MTTLADVGSELDWAPTLWTVGSLGLLWLALWLGERWERAGRVIDNGIEMLDRPTTPDGGRRA